MGDKYDRQLRLWGAEGQRRLGGAHVLLVGAGATGAETLKNLVLPGVQRVTVLDGQRVTRADASNSFFVTAAAAGRARAQVVAELLLEMNGDVAGAAREADPLSVLQHEPEYLDQFDVVIATQLDEAPTKLLSDLCLAKRIPLLLVVSYGLVGYLRLQAAQHAIVDAKHDPPLHELRVSRPFPALRAFADSIDLDALSSIDHAHVPFVVLLLKAMDKWKAQHGGAIPSAFADKMAFKQSLLAMAWGPPGHEVNFLEAADSAYRAYAPPLVPEEVAAVLRVAKQHAPQFTAQTEDFWWLARALAEFVETQNDGMLPVTGVVPDMTAATDTYVALQEIYMTKAAEDAAAVQRILQTHLAAAGLPQDRISRDQVATFCKNAYNIAMLDTRSLAQEFAQVDLSGVDIEEENSQQSPIIWYFMLRAVAAFVSTFHRYPGSERKDDDDGEEDDETSKQDRAWLVGKARQLATAGTSNDGEIGRQVAAWISDAHALEMTRSCEVELHNVAALMGGVASQEAVKLITHQFVPLEHTYVFNGICGLAATYNL